MLCAPVEDSLCDDRAHTGQRVQGSCVSGVEIEETADRASACRPNANGT